MASSKGIAPAKFSVNNPKGKVSTKSGSDSTNPFPGRKDKDSMRNKAGASQSSQTSYAGKGATSTGFVATRAREFK